MERGGVVALHMPGRESKAAAAMSAAASNPNLSAAQVAAAKKLKYPPVPAHCVVTGGTGFVGQRLVEMLAERGAKRVVSFDIVAPPAGAWKHPAIEYVTGDLADKAAVMAVCKGADCVWHNAAAVGPFHPQELYHRVNYKGTLNVIEACRQHGVPKIVMSSSPSTRFDGSDIDGLTEADMPELPMSTYMQAYAESKAHGELAMSAACSDELMTVSVAPHQVYGPRDNLFMPNMLEAAGSGLLRIFATGDTGYGRNRVCFTHVDNYAHGLIIAERALVPGGRALGKFYIVTDGNTHPDPRGFGLFWEVIDEAVTGMGFDSLWSKFKLPAWFLYPVAHICDGVGWLLGKKLKLNPFNVRVLTMHRWFDISAAENDLGFKPIIDWREGWDDNIAWHRKHWLPAFTARRESAASLTGLAQQSQAKIDVQAAGTSDSK